MHREYRPADMHDLRAGAFGAAQNHDHHHDHPEHHVHERSDRSLYTLTAVLGALIGADVLFGALGLESWRAPGGVSLIVVAALLGGARIVYGALDALLHRSIGADVALAQACIAALVIGQPFVAAEVVFIALVGEVLEAVTFERTRRAIHRLIDQSPRTARVRRDGTELEIPAATVAVGDVVIVRAGERIPVDGPVLVGRSTVDQSALTGESLPVDKGPSDPVYTGTLNQFGTIEVQAEKVGHETTFGQVLKLVADAQRRKSPLERTADRLARYFLPVVEIVAGLTLLAGYLLGWPDVWQRTVAVLVVACPCALVLATPAAVLASMAWLARHGILIKGGAALERLAACDTFAFDKTGTLTHGRPEIAGVTPLGTISEDELWRLAATAEQSSPHPLGSAVTREANRRGVVPYAVSEAVALPGAGVSARYGDASDGANTVLVGNRRLLTENGVAIDPTTDAALAELDARGETALLVARNSEVVGAIGLRDTVRPEAHDVIHDLKHLHITEIAILTGDRESAAKIVAKKTHIKTLRAELLPKDKAEWIEQAQANGRLVAMVGDGINDAPALARAHVGIALGGIGADIAAEAGDLIVLGEPLRTLPDLVKLSRATVAVIRQNIIIFAFGLNAVAMGAAALGVLGPVPAAILHQAGSFLVLLNAMRLLVFGDWPSLPPFRQARALAAGIQRLDDRFDPGHAIDGLLARWRALVVAGCGIAAVAYATWGWTIAGPGEVLMVRRFGRFTATHGPGLHLGWPPPFETVTRLTPERVRSLAIGFRTNEEGPSGVRWESSHGRGVTARVDDESLLLTGDGQLVELAASAQYRLNASKTDSLRAYAFGVIDPDAALRPLAESAVRKIVGHRGLESLLTKGRRDAEREAQFELQQRVEAYGLGVVITAVAFQDVHPPLAVVDAYRDVSRAGSDRQRRANEGAAYRVETVAAGRGKAAETVNRAEGARASRVAIASGEADAFRYVAAARRGHAALTDVRLYWNLIAESLADQPKLILDPGQSRPRHLIVPDGLDSRRELPPVLPAAAIPPPKP